MSQDEIIKEYKAVVYRKYYYYFIIGLDMALPLITLFYQVFAIYRGFVSHEVRFFIYVAVASVLSHIIHRLIQSILKDELKKLEYLRKHLQ